MSASDAAAAILLLAGATFCALGAVGLVRFPDLLTRLHAVAKPQSLGILLILAGAGVRLGRPAAVAPLLLAALFQATTAPLIAQTIARIGYQRGDVRADLLTVDELARDLERGPAGGHPDGGAR